MTQQTTRPIDPEELVQVLDAMREGLQIIDKDWRYTYVNAAAARHGRSEVASLLGRTMLDCYPGIEQTDMFRVLRHSMVERVPRALRNEFSYPDGKTATFELRVEPCSVGIMVLSIDVSESSRLEAQLLHAQKMEAVGRLAGSIAHDFNNVLSVILSYCGLLLSDLRPMDPIRADLETVQQAGQRAALLTRQLLAFSRQQLLSARVVDLNELVESAQQMFARLLGEDVEVVTYYDRRLPRVKVDPGQVDQVIMNLLVNARDAMPMGGKLTIETKRCVLDGSYASTHFDVTPGTYAMLAISDTGAGMSQDVQARIFEPFFTTKGPEKGTGLGLSTVFGIVKQSGGSVWVYSEPGQGTTFRIYFPQTAAERDEPSESTRPRSLRGSETILLVEDQMDVRKATAKVLERNGYHVLQAANAGEALLICEQHPRSIHLLLSDVVMPRMSGAELAERLAALRPRMRVLYMSGYADAAIVQHGILDPGVAYLQKPIAPEQLCLRVREVLDGPDRQSRSPRSTPSEGE